MLNLKTYSHLSKKKRRPTDYEIASSNLLYYTKNGFEVNLPMGEWYKKHQVESPFQCSDWEKFYDPRETTYFKYTRLQRAKETFLDGILESIEKTRYDFDLSEEWIKNLSLILAPLRYPWHGFQMTSAYIGQMSPSGRIVITSMFQSADELRRIERIAYRLALLQKCKPGFGEDSKHLWETDPLWQPLREAVENLLITYDWGQAFTRLNLILKPILDYLFIYHFGSVAMKCGDPLLSEILFSFEQDNEWQRDWARALVRMAIEDHPANKEVLLEWIEEWSPVALNAILPIVQRFNSMERLHETDQDVFELIKMKHQEFLSTANLGIPRILQ